MVLVMPTALYAFCIARSAVDLLLVRGGRAVAESRKQLRRAEDQAGGLAFLILDDLAVGGLRRIARDAELGEDLRIDHRRVAVVRHGEAARRGFVDLVASRVAAILQSRGIDLRNEDDSIRRKRGRLLAHVGLDFGDRMHHRHGPFAFAQRRGDRMRVAVFEARQDRAAMQIDQLGVWPGESADLGVGPGLDEAIAGDCDSFHLGLRLATW